MSFRGMARFWVQATAFSVMKRTSPSSCDFTLPPYNEYVVLGPADPDKVAAEVSARTGHPTLITDINDLGGNILGRYPRDLPDDLRGASSTPWARAVESGISQAVSVMNLIFSIKAASFCAL